MDRMAMFRLWLARLTPEKVELLVRLEKISRMLTHVHDLNGTWDEKLLVDLTKTSAEIRGHYSERYDVTKTNKPNDVSGTGLGSGDEPQGNRPVAKVTEGGAV